jgi:hypothetical protein
MNRGEGEAPREDEGGYPPFVSGWKAFYALVLGVFVLCVLLFYGIQAWSR